MLALLIASILFILIISFDYIDVGVDDLLLYHSVGFLFPLAVFRER